MANEREVEEIQELAQQIMPLMRGHHRNVQWGALAEVMAIWLYDHVGDQSRVLEPMLRVHVNAVRKMVLAHAARQATAPEPARRWAASPVEDK